jgi:large subunit ribosomal protein L18e
MKINAEKENVKEWLAVLEKHAAERKGIWKSVYKNMAVPSRRRAFVNIYKLNKYTKSGEMVVVPGKVLSIGAMDHSISIAALEYSAQALAKLKASGCKLMNISDMVTQSNVRIIK